jgi:hypothetical protein
MWPKFRHFMGASCVSKNNWESATLGSLLSAAFLPSGSLFFYFRNLLYKFILFMEVLADCSSLSLSFSLLLLLLLLLLLSVGLGCGPAKDLLTTATFPLLFGMAE